MVSRSRVLTLVEGGMRFEEIGLALDISPGLAYLVATGMAADASGGWAPEDLDRVGAIRGSTQHLFSPPRSEPTDQALVAEWVLQLALSDGPMRAAARGRWVAAGKPGAPVAAGEQGERGASTRTDGRADAGSEADGHNEVDNEVTAVLSRSHDEAKAILRELKAASRTRSAGSLHAHSRRAAIADLLVARLSAHEAAEQQLFWPAVADTLDGGPSIAQLARRQEKEAKEVLDKLRKLARAAGAGPDPAGPDPAHFDELVEQLSDLLRRHVAYEEAVFARMRETVPEEARRELGARVRRALSFGPTRPHPLAPSGAAALHLAGPVTAAIDRLRDRAGRRPRSTRIGSVPGEGARR